MIRSGEDDTTLELAYRIRVNLSFRSKVYVVTFSPISREMMMRSSQSMSVLALIAGLHFSDRVTAEALVSQGLPSTSYTASNTLGPANLPLRAFDGDATGPGWSAGAGALQWIEVDLQQSRPLTRFSLTVAQNPVGTTVHEIWAGNDPIGAGTNMATLLTTIAGFTQSFDVLEFMPAQAFQARFVQIRTIQSPSWVAWQDIQVFSKSTYRLTSSPVTWLEAEAEAVAAGGHLATISDSAEQALLIEQFGSDQEYWIGLNDQSVEGTFAWSSGEQLSYVNWALNEPNNSGDEDYVVMNWNPTSAAGNWNDLPNSALGFVSQGIIELPVPEPPSEVIIGAALIVGAWQGCRVRSRHHRDSQEWLP